MISENASELLEVGRHDLNVNCRRQFVYNKIVKNVFYLYIYYVTPGIEIGLLTIIFDWIEFIARNKSQVKKNEVFIRGEMIFLIFSNVSVP